MMNAASAYITKRLAPLFHLFCAEAMAIYLLLFGQAFKLKKIFFTKL